MIASAYFSPPTRQTIDAAESAYGDGAAVWLNRDSSAASPFVAPAPVAQHPAVERHGADGVPLPSSAPTIDRYVIDAASCWIWQGCIDRSGYGQVRRNGRTLLAHRALFEEFNGPIPDGLELDHLCRRTACVNPDHLEPVSRDENIRRRYAVYSACLRGHSLTDPENVRIDKHGRRICRACDVIRHANLRERRKVRP